MGKKSDQFDRIEEHMAELVELLQKLVNKGDSNIPAPAPEPNHPYLTPPTLHPAKPWQGEPPLPTPKNDEVTCVKCGMRFRGVMGFVCNNVECPMGCGPVTC